MNKKQGARPSVCPLLLYEKHDGPEWNDAIFSIRPELQPDAQWVRGRENS